MNPDFKKLEKELRKFFEVFPSLAAEEALQFFDDSWENQGFTNRGLKRWKTVLDKKTGTNKQKALVDSGTLRGSIKFKISKASAIIYTDVAYAKIHNSGGSIIGTFAVKSHTRRIRGRDVTIKAHTRNVNFSIPQRQFLGDSPELDKRIEKIIVKQIDKIFKF